MRPRERYFADAAGLIEGETLLPAAAPGPLGGQLDGLVVEVGFRGRGSAYRIEALVGSRAVLLAPAFEPLSDEVHRVVFSDRPDVLDPGSSEPATDVARFPAEPLAYLRGAALAGEQIAVRITPVSDGPPSEAVGAIFHLLVAVERSDRIFASGFESGTAGSWSAVQ